MTSATKLLQKMGSTISESIGGEGVQQMLTASPAGATPAVAGSMVGRSRNRQAGTVDINQVMPDIDQPRKEFSEETLVRLAESLKKRGQLQNVRVRWSEALKKWVLISGERRYRAALLAGLKTLNCEFVERDLTEAERLEEQLVENCLREDLNSLELAQAYQKIMTLRGCSAKELAAELDITPGAVTKVLAVLKLPEDLQAQVAEGSLPRSSAYEISRLENEDEQRAMAERVQEAGLTNTQVAEEVQTRQGRRNHATTKTGRRLSCALPSGESVTVASKEELTWDGVIAALNELLKAAKKAKAAGQELEELPGLLKAKEKKK
jgi:ParB family transcriptional regulator, chromosome partitioning protein